jgi:hypothetical protein
MLCGRYRKHTRYIKNNDPQSAYALHILQNIHEYSTINDTVTLLQPIQNTTLLVVLYEQMIMQHYHQKGKPIPEQQRGKPNPLLLLAHDICTTQ